MLHMLMFSANIYFWRRYRVNYAFIFGFKQGTGLSYRQVLLLSSALSVITLAGVLSNLDMEMDPTTQSFEALTELVPLGIVTVRSLVLLSFYLTKQAYVFQTSVNSSTSHFQVLLLIIFCPFNIIYRSSRFFFIQCAFHCICAPLYKVTTLGLQILDKLMESHLPFCFHMPAGHSP